MEMNTRLQVEHPVTEAVTGLDLVEWQLRIASGEPLPLAQDEIAISGHAIEARLYAEDPARGFLPSIGPLTEFFIPDLGARIDSGVEKGGEISPFYDPMIAKQIVHAPTRAEAASQLALVCGGVEVWPVKTNAGFLARLVSEPDFLAGEVDTGFIEARLETLTAKPPPSAFLLTEAASALAEPDDGTPWAAGPLAGFRLAAAPAPSLIQEGERTYEAHVDPTLESAWTAHEGEVVLFEGGEAYAFRRPYSAAEDAEHTGDGQVRAPMPGRIVLLPVEAGEKVAKGQTLVTLEAMKMEHAQAAPFAATVAEVLCKVGDQVTEGALLIRLEAAD
jgi:propionyl-CoA carboxylase alpha chain/3-methylcrotonyl-CoA carboxylase alpha subunit